MSRSPTENHLESPLKLPLRTHLRRVPRVPEYPKPGESLRTPPELATCPECRSRDNLPPGCRAKAPRVPKPTPRAQPGDSPTTLRVLSESDTCPRVPDPPGSLRVCHVPRASFSPDDLRMRHVSRAVDHTGIARQRHEPFYGRPPPPGPRRVRPVSRPPL